MIVEKLLEECVRSDPMPYRWDELMERTVLRWMQRAYDAGRAEMIEGQRIASGRGIFGG